MTTLQQRILEAHGEVARSVPGARARLAELQRQFREGRHLVDRFPRGATATLAEPGTATSLPRRKPRRAVARSQAPQRPAWQLREVPYWKLRR